MKSPLLAILFFFIVAVGYSQETKLLGDVTISLKEGKLDSDFYLTNLATTDKTLLFMLNDGIKVKAITVAGQRANFSKSNRNCADCTVYSIALREDLAPSDTLLIKTKGSFKSYYNGKNTKDYKGKIVNNYGILRASEQAKWYPIVLSAQDNKPSFLKKHTYNYQIKANCTDCDYVYVGQDEPQKNGGVFSSPVATQDIMLIAGNYTWKQGSNALFLNVKDDALITYIDSLFLEINSYYEGLTNIQMPAQFTYAHLPSDSNTGWGGFLTYPTLVDVKKKPGRNDLEPYLAHEVAHYLFGNVFQPESKLYWFYLESFAQYFSYKYLLAKNPKLMKGRISYLNEKHFVRLDQVTDFDQVNGNYRYSIGPVQLLAIEERIGEAQMMQFIQHVFSNLGQDVDGYAVLINSLHEIGVDAATIQAIENDLIKKFEREQYKFIEQKIAGYSQTK